MPQTPYLAQKRRDYEKRNGPFRMLPLNVRRELMGSWSIEYRLELRSHAERVVQVVLFNHSRNIGPFRDRLLAYIGPADSKLRMGNYRSKAVESVMDLYENGLTTQSPRWQVIMAMPATEQILAIRRSFRLSPGGAGLLRELMEMLQ